MKPELPAGVILDATSQKLIEAALYMEKHGHCKGTFRNGNAVCLMGAMMGVASLPVALSDCLQRVEAYLGESPPEWNDRPETTAEDAIAALWGAALMGRT